MTSASSCKSLPANCNRNTSNSSSSNKNNNKNNKKKKYLRPQKKQRKSQRNRGKNNPNPRWSAWMRLANPDVPAAEVDAIGATRAKPPAPVHKALLNPLRAVTTRQQQQQQQQMVRQQWTAQARQRSSPMGIERSP